MTETFRKLNFKAQDPILVLSAPDSFLKEIEAVSAITTLHAEAKKGVRYGFALAFAWTKRDLVAAAKRLLPALLDDAVLWFAYPKKTAPNIASDLSRDLAWELLAPFGLKPNRQIAIDENWSALRFKQTQGPAQP